MKWPMIALALMLGTLPLKAGVPGKTADTPRSYELAVIGIGGQNRTWGGYGGGALQASLPVLKKLDILTGIQGLSPGVMAGPASVPA